MGGEGSMAGAILSLKENRALLKKRSVRELRDLLREKSGETELGFKKMSAKELAQIKEQIRKEARKSARKELVVYTISFLAVLILFYLIHRFLFDRLAVATA